MAEFIGEPNGTGRRFGVAELRELREALAQNTLFYAKGKKVRQFCAELAAKYAVDVPAHWRLTRTAETAAAGQLCLTPGCSQLDGGCGGTCVPLLPQVGVAARC